MMPMNIRMVKKNPIELNIMVFHIVGADKCREISAMLLSVRSVIRPSSGGIFDPIRKVCLAILYFTHFHEIDIHLHKNKTCPENILAAYLSRLY